MPSKWRSTRIVNDFFFILNWSHQIFFYTSDIYFDKIDLTQTEIFKERCKFWFYNDFLVLLRWLWQFFVAGIVAPLNWTWPTFSLITKKSFDFGDTLQTSYKKFSELQFLHLGNSEILRLRKVSCNANRSLFFPILSLRYI